MSVTVKQLLTSFDPETVETISFDAGAVERGTAVPARDGTAESGAPALGDPRRALQAIEADLQRIALVLDAVGEALDGEVAVAAAHCAIRTLGVRRAVDRLARALSGGAEQRSPEQRFVELLALAS